MVGWLMLSKELGGWRVATERRQVLGLPLLCALVPAAGDERPRVLARRIGRAARALARAGCRRVLTQADFQHWDLLRGWGLSPVGTEGLCRALAAPLLLEALAGRGLDPGRASVGLWSRRVGRACFQAAQVLCPRVRQLVVDAPDGGEALARFLREEYGVAVLEAGPGRRVDAAACFSPAPGAPPEALQLWGERPCLGGLEITLEGALPPDQADPMALAALLWEEGRVDVRELRVRRRIEIDLTEEGKLHIIHK